MNLLSVHTGQVLKIQLERFPNFIIKTFLQFSHKKSMGAILELKKAATLFISENVNFSELTWRFQTADAIYIQLHITLKIT